MTDAPNTYTTFQAFWPFYLSQHSLRTTRLIHVIGTLLALMVFIKAILTFSLSALAAALVFGYGFAWIAHALVEKNRPATFTYPLWSLLGDFYMLGLWLNGRLEAELMRHKILT
jgi:hypothetical protein